MCKNLIYLVCLVLVLTLISSASGQEFYTWVGDPCDANSGQWDEPNNWDLGEVPPHDSGNVGLSTGFGSVITIPAGYTADCTYGVIWGTIYGPEWGTQLDIYGTLTYDWYFAPVQSEPCDAWRSVINMYDGSSIGPHPTDPGTNGTGGAEGIALGGNWWFYGPYVTMNMYEGSSVDTNWLWIGGWLNLYGGTMDISGGVNMGAVGSYPVADELIRINIEEGTLILPADFTDEVEDWISRGILLAYGETPGQPRGPSITIDTEVNPGRTTVTASPSPPPWPTNPNPRDLATDVSRTPTLTWTPGRYAAYTEGHRVYFDPDEQKVIDRSGCEVNGVSTTDPCYPIPSPLVPNPLELNRTYYWAVDEVNDVCEPKLWEGKVWSFTVANYLVVDDMESYNDLLPDDPNSNRINYTWEDGFGCGSEQYPPRLCGNGTGSLIGHELEPIAETTIVHGGGQSMPYYYVNDGSGENNCGNPIELYYSKAKRTFDEPQDWTREGVKAVTLYFYGDPDNDINEPMWVKLRDQSDDSGKVTYGSYADEDVKNLAYPFWHEWNIELAEFGIDLNDVNSIAIGFGNEDATTQGGSGIVYFDDIRLYLPRRVPSRLKPEADLTDDCVVDYDDIVILAERWLDSGLIVTPVDPVNDLVGHWKLDDGSGTTAVDSSTNNNDANLVGNALWMTAGYDDGALLFDGNDAYVELPIDSLIGSLTNSTFATWANFSNTGGAWQRIFDFGIDPNEADPNVYMFLTPRMGTADPMRFAITTAGAGAEEQATAADTLPSGWHHVAVTIDADNDTITLYLDGSVAAQNTEATLSPSDLGEPNNNWLGRSQFVADANYAGLLDDFRIYSRALSTAEVAGLAGRTEPFSISADLYEDGVIDLKDFADLGAAWLEERLWPPEP